MVNMNGGPANNGLWLGYDFEIKSEVVIDNYDIIKQTQSNNGNTGGGGTHERGSSSGGLGHNHLVGFGGAGYPHNQQGALSVQNHSSHKNQKHWRRTWHTVAPTIISSIKLNCYKLYITIKQTETRAWHFSNHCSHFPSNAITSNNPRSEVLAQQKVASLLCSFFAYLPSWVKPHPDSPGASNGCMTRFGSSMPCTHWLHIWILDAVKF